MNDALNVTIIFFLLVTVESAEVAILTILRYTRKKLFLDETACHLLVILFTVTRKTETKNKKEQKEEQEQEQEEERKQDE